MARACQSWAPWVLYFISVNRNCYLLIKPSQLNFAARFLVAPKRRESWAHQGNRQAGCLCVTLLAGSASRGRCAQPENSSKCMHNDIMYAHVRWRLSLYLGLGSPTAASMLQPIKALLRTGNVQCVPVWIWQHHWGDKSAGDRLQVSIDNQLDKILAISPGVTLCDRPQHSRKTRCHLDT